MLKELTKKDWLALLGIPEDMIPAVLVLRGTRNLKSIMKNTNLISKM
ncbi:MAG: hypothetical protein AB1546_09015 [bacterium]